jgi:RNA polymerase sigma factor (sigma-70 family)
MSHRQLTTQEKHDLHLQLAYFWKDRTPEERNAYANVLVFLVLTGDDPVAPAALEIIVHEIIKNPGTPMPVTSDYDKELRDQVAVVVMDKLRGATRDTPADETADATPGRPWQRLAAYHSEYAVDGGNFRAWVKAVAYRTAVDLVRRDPMATGSYALRPAVRTVPIDEWDDGEESVERWYNQTPLPLRIDVLHTLATTGKWLEEQDPLDSRILCLRVDHGLEYAEIAEQVALSTEAVRKRITRLRDKLRQYLREALALDGTAE